jgi:hypothetical protein
MKQIKCENITTVTEARFLPIAPIRKTDRLTPGSRQTQSQPDPKIGSIIALLEFSPRVGTVRTEFKILLIARKAHT